MTRIRFYFNVQRKTEFACRLTRKLYLDGRDVGIVAPPQQLQDLDLALWEFSALDFIPHEVRESGTPETAVRCVILAPQPQGLPKDDVLVQLHTQVPGGFERFRALVEVVGSDAADRQQARERWRYYAERGYDLKAHDMGRAR